MEQTEEKTWKRFLNKQVSVSKKIGNKNYFYRGRIIEILTDKIILDDRKIGTIPLSFDGLSIIAINGDGQ